MSEIKRRPRLRLNLRPMIVLALLTGGSEWGVNRAHAQAQQAVAVIVAGGGRVSYKAQKVTQVDLFGVATPEIWAAVSSLDSLTELNFQPFKPVTGISGLRKLLRVKSVSIGMNRKHYCLRITSLPIDHASIEELVSIPNLESLSVLSLQLTPVDLQRIGTARNLRELILDSDYRVTEGCYAPLAKLDQLRVLELGSTPRFHDRSLHELAPILPNLERLDLEFVAITDRGMAEFQACKNLKWLSVCSDEEITDAGLAHLADLPNLEVLTITGARINDAGLIHLRKMPSIKYATIRLGEGTITKAGIDALKAAKPTLDFNAH